MKTKIVCINLKHCTQRRQNIENTLAKTTVPFEFFDAIHYKDVEVVDNLENCKILGISETGEFKCDVGYDTVIKIKGETTELTHDPKAYLIDQIQHFGRIQFLKYHNIPYADITVTDHDEPDKRWFTYNGMSMFIDVGNFRKYLTEPEMACSLSHYYVLKKLIEDEEYDSYIILEDDVLLNETPPEHTLENMLRHLELYDKYWDIAFLNEAIFLSTNSLFSISEHLNLGVYCSFTNACSYVVTKACARKLLERYEGAINIAADDFLSRQQDLKMVRLKKPLFHIDGTQPSNIRLPEVEDEHEEFCIKFRERTQQK